MSEERERERERERSLFCLTGGTVRDPTSPFPLSLSLSVSLALSQFIFFLSALLLWHERSML